MIGGNRKGMLSTLDAVIFVTILAVVAAGLVSVPEIDDPTPDASEICGDLFEVRLQSSCILPDSGDSVYLMTDLTAIALASGETVFLEDYIERAVSGTLSGRYGYTLTAECGGAECCFGDGRGRTVSSFTAVYDVIGDTDLSVTLTIFD